MSDFTQETTQTRFRLEDCFMSSTIYTDNPTVQYVKGDFRFQPQQSKAKYTQEVDTVKKRFGESLERNVVHNSDFDNRYLCSIDLRSGGLKQNKTTRAKFEFYVIPITETPVHTVMNLTCTVTADIQAALNEVGFKPILRENLSNT